MTKRQELKIKSFLSRRLRAEPLAYILGQKEFFGLNFKVNRHTLIPRPETELLIEEVLKLKLENNTIVDIGTGSGNIIVSLAKNIQEKNKFIAIDISGEALKVAKQNAKTHGVAKKIKFYEGNLLDPILKDNCQLQKIKNLIILANLPYLSEEIYAATAPTVKKYEPKSALYSAQDGLAHYEKLLKQIRKLATGYKLRTINFFEISPEQKPKIHKLIRAYLPQAKIEFFKDLAGKWRLSKISL